MRPAFTSNWQAGGFVLLVISLLLLPVICWNRLSDREQAYSFCGWNVTPFPWIAHETFEETNDIDIAFIGSSRLFQAIETPQIQADLSRHLGRPAVVRTIGWMGAGVDAYYFTAKDFLARRKVKIVVFFDDSGFEPQFQNAQVSEWFNLKEDWGDLTGLSWTAKLPYYFVSAMGAGKSLLLSVRDNLPANYSKGKPYPNTLGAVNSLGSLSVTNWMTEGAYKDTNLSAKATPADVLVYSPETSSGFHFSNPPQPPWEVFFQTKFQKMVESHGCHLVLLHMPILAETNCMQVEEKRIWPDTTMIGIPTGKLFDGLTSQQIRMLFMEKSHLNRNGQKYFTSLVTPALLKIYDQKNIH